MKRSLIAAPLILIILLGATGTTSAASVQWHVLDAETGADISNATVVVFRSGETVPFLSGLTEANGTFLADLPAGSYIVEVSAPGFGSVSRALALAENDTDTSDWRLHQGSAAAQSGSPVILLLLPLLATGALLGALLFSRIQRNDLLQHVARQRLFEFIQANPGKHYRAIVDALGLGMGTITHHLNALERGGYIASQQDGMYRRFYPAGKRTEATFFLTAVQQRIVLLLKVNAGISQARLADSLAISPSLANYHLHILADAGLVRLERRGRETGCFLLDAPAAPGQ